ncbi:Rne/Rng family ribonuclease [Nocardioides sp. URHA0020]|uniref:Rne/Rng family ribonuclease n=1 Tax=Nocardioides sp. URHA0020 TaxID=1380392 RepID=UPI000688A956|nr:Rne/Rng family ribonuclease [Nocardioides sp. URHA0020]
MADDLQPGADDTTAAGADPAADKPAKKASAVKAAAKKAPAKKAAAKKAPAAKKTAAKKTAAAKTAEAEPGEAQLDLGVEAAPAKKAAKRAPAKRAAKKAAPAPAADEVTPETPAEAPVETPAEASPTALLFQAPEPTKKTAARRPRKTAAERAAEAAAAEAPADVEAPAAPSEEDAAEQAPRTPRKRSASRSGGRQGAKAAPPVDEDEDETSDVDDETDESADGDESGDGSGPARRRRRRGGRRRRKPGDATGDGDSEDSDDSSDSSGSSDESAEGSSDRSAPGGEDGGDSPSSRRRRRRRRTGEDGGGEGGDDPENTVTRVRRQRSAEDEITSIQGSTRLEAKKQRRREGREAGRRRAPIVSEAEFLARREAVDRVMVVRQRDELTQIGVLEDKVLVEHYVARASQTSLIGNVYVGRVQNVLPSMEAAFIDIGKGRNAVLYAGEVNWSALGHKDGQPRKIESVLSSGQSILVQVSKDPVGHKGARLTSQISLAGRFLVYVPDGTTSGISRKLPDTERNRLKTLLKEIVPDTAGVIVRTAAEGASEDELTRDVERLKARWEDIEAHVKGQAPQLLYGEPDLTLKVVRDLFTEDFSKLVIQGDDAWDTVQGYVQHVAPDLESRLERYEPGANGRGGKADVFAEYRIEEQIAKGLDRKVWLPSGGSLVIDRTEAMTVVDVNTGKFTGSGGNLEETVTKNNLEAAEEIVRQLRLRDIGGIIVVDFIDMVLESNRDLVLRRLVECLGRDRTRHQVAEVTSLGLVQMTRKRIGTGLVEAFSENCSHCQGRGLVIQDTPVEPRQSDDEPRRGGGGSGGGSGSGGGRRGRGRGRGQDDNASGGGNGGGDTGGGVKPPSPKDVAAMARPEAESAEALVDETAPVVEPVETASVVEPVETAPVVEPVDTAPVVEPASVVEPVETPAAEPAAPKVTTRSRRRSAPRAAAEPAPVVVAEPVAEPVVEAPVVEEPAVEAPPAPPEPPKVITRTRGRAASRPAGPPVEVAPQEPVDATGDDSSNDDEHADGDQPHVEHVPIKKKGSRKR